MKKILLSLLLAGGVQNSLAMQAGAGGQAVEDGSRVEGQVPVIFKDGSVVYLDLQRLKALNSGLLEVMLFTADGLSSIREGSEEDNLIVMQVFTNLADFENFETAFKLSLQGEIEDMVDFFKKADFLGINTDNYLKGLLATRDLTQFFKLCRALLEANQRFVLNMQRVYPEILHEAIRTKDPDFAKMLIDAGADVKVIGRFGETALICAAKNGYTEIAQLLIAAAGADVGTHINARDSNGQTALISAASNMHPSHFGQQLTKTVQLLIGAGADVNASDIWDQTALMKAATWGYTEIVKLLITAGADVKARNIRGETALMLAAQEGYTEIVRLLSAAGADVNDFNRNGRTALMNAANHGYEETVQLLIDKGADVNVRDYSGNTALMIAKEMGRTEIVQLLRAHGAV